MALLRFLKQMPFGLTASVVAKICSNVINFFTKPFFIFFNFERIARASGACDEFMSNSWQLEKIKVFPKDLIARPATP